MVDNWVVLKDGVAVPAKPQGVWTLALEWVDGPAVLKFEAGDEEWFYSESEAAKSKADGHLSSLLATKHCLLPSAPVGALIGKIGGSSAGASDGGLFVVGKFCLLEIDKGKGPLYLTINDELTAFGNNRGEIKVKISSRPSPTPDKPKAATGPLRASMIELPPARSAATHAGSSARVEASRLAGPSAGPRATQSNGRSSVSDFSSQKVMPISRYIVAATVRCSRALACSPVHR